MALLINSLQTADGRAKLGLGGQPTGGPGGGDKGRPVSSTPVSGTPWCVVWTGDRRVFFYNPSTKTSVWERPPDLVGRMDVEELLRAIPAVKNLLPPAQVKKAEATSTTESANNSISNAVAAATAAAMQPTLSDLSAAISQHLQHHQQQQQQQQQLQLQPQVPEGGPLPKFDTKIVINLEGGKRGREKRDSGGSGGGAPPEKKSKTTDSDSESEIKIRFEVTIDYAMGRTIILFFFVGILQVVQCGR
jgi:hypothetical protein